MVMSEHFQRKDYSAGQMIFCEGDQGDFMYLVQKGSVEIWRLSGHIKWVLGIIPVGGVFGEMALFDGKPRMASATAVEETTLVWIPASVVRSVLKKTDPLLARLVRVLLDDIRRLANQFDARLEEMSETDLEKLYNPDGR